jgi:hypothetical protein
MCRKIVAVVAAAVLAAVLIGGLFLLRYYGAEGPCGMDDPSRQIGSAIKMGDCLRSS